MKQVFWGSWNQNFLRSLAMVGRLLLNFWKIFLWILHLGDDIYETSFKKGKTSLYLSFYHHQGGGEDKIFDKLQKEQYNHKKVRTTG